MNPDRKAINRWAREAGYNDFDSYIQAGGSILDARENIILLIRSLHSALAALDRRTRKDSRLDAPNPDEPPNPQNAQIQGAEHCQ